VSISRRPAKTEVGASVRSEIHRGRTTLRMPEFVISTALSSPTATYGRSRSTAHRDSPRSAGTGGTPATTNTAPPARSSAVYTARDPVSRARPPATVPTEKPTLVTEGRQAAQPVGRMELKCRRVRVAQRGQHGEPFTHVGDQSG
jgi:hypothetical protein